jgi:hypothetical protein
VVSHPHQFHNPGFGKPTGVLTSTVLLVVLSGGLYLLFKRLGWL